MQSNDKSPIGIEYSAPVLEEIRGAATGAFFAMRHGGMEIGGVLFGERWTGGVRILAARPLACDHALGPGFLLSEKDHARLRLLLEDGCRDLRARGWQPVGWYVSHTRSGICLSGRDAQLYDRYFPEPWHIALVVRPHAVEPTRAGFFCRGLDGSPILEGRFGEFVLEAPKTSPALLTAIGDSGCASRARGIAGSAGSGIPLRYAAAPGGGLVGHAGPEFGCGPVRAGARAPSGNAAPPAAFGVVDGLRLRRPIADPLGPFRGAGAPSRGGHL